MSRLDDELKIAFRRQEPSPDFAARLLERINTSPAPRPGFRQRLAALFEMPRFRLAAIGATAVMVVAIGAAGYIRLNQATVKESGMIAAVNSADAGMDLTNVWPKPVARKQSGSNTHEPRKSRANVVAVRREARPSPEAEAAKVRVLFALQVAGSTLNDVQKAIHYDGPNDKPEPLNNR